jgi:16S rRNA (adenine1518-N6/adenine1519-N6)-dimethyltransferase
VKPHTPRKRFGQHFLIDDEIIQHIVDVIHPVEGEHLVEIGPGQGALTFPVLNRISEIDVVELDYDLIPILLARSKKFCNTSQR